MQRIPIQYIFDQFDYGGDVILHLYTESKLRQLKFRVMHIRVNSTMRKRFLPTLKCVKLTPIHYITPLF